MKDIIANSKKKNIFILNRSELEERFDSEFYKSEFKIYSDILKKMKTVTLFSFCKKIMSGPFGSTLKSEDYNKGSIPFIRIKNIKNGEIDESDLVFISEEDNQRIQNSQLEGRDLVLSKIGTVGEVAVIPTHFAKCNISENNIGIKIKPETNEHYLKIMLGTNILKSQMLKNLSGNVQKFLNVDTVKNLKLPLINKERQEQIVYIYQSAQKKKQQKESEAKALLTSIDDYILSELGITFIERKNSLKSRIFTVNFSEVTSERLDAFYYANDFLHIEKELKEKKTNIVFFKDIINSITNGFDFRDYKENGTPYIKVANVRKGKFDFSKIQYIEISSEELVKKIQLKKGNLLLTRKGTFGNALALTKDYNYIISSEVFYIELKHQKINPSYLEAFFNSSLGQKQFEKFSIGAIMGSLSQEALKKLIIPLPSMEKQNKIATHINNIYKQIEKLQNDATVILETAKREVEEMIIG